ncbi:phosphatidylinositol alpha-1,6-mannosyltransferase [Sphingobacterium allocomposti]|jgi:glycosyltransferase involved in cell wall biosynthesis|uniref:Phosphatidylinositol alpha-1,6-mannosyltransferase n=1 Tax=Sphingobacterium allocomposti TaxID=415956 RepID=A0A5S5DL94_9SPHI|nr:glycosyltransferase family 4 protein [Sphingobacterium composti Yoo et al. 2007 non Ten et al. 2007]TYP96700.1 phosphatidylinositol alpha-1,6-mannosyltransferase [Sphingobacterium composti Yoo et al. 2007 non Ten et al. 2007]HLS94289.1 glycosyltransferase family 4 protein [Sphingobacterium sp.]
MEVLFVSHKYPPSTGGMEKQSYELIKGMCNYAIVHKIVYTGDESYYRFFRKLNDRILKMVHTHPGIGVIHFNDGLIASLSLWHSGYQHLKRVVTVHGLDVVFPWKIYQRFIIPRFNRYDHIIAVSRATADAIIERGVDASKVSVVVNGIDHELASPTSAHSWSSFREKYAVPDNRTVLVTLGRPVKRKGFSWFIREVLPTLPENVYLVMAGPFYPHPTKRDQWIAKLPPRWRELYMLFMGYPSDEAELRHLLTDAKYADKVKHLGKLPIEDLKILLSHADAFLMPNIKVAGDMEGFGLVCLEACICGSLVLAAKLEGINDAIIDQKNGIQIAPQDPHAWRRAIEEVVSNNGTSTEQRQRFRQFTLEHFSWQKMAEGYAAVFTKLLQS